MPLVVATLHAAMREFMDEEYDGFVAFPEDAADGARLWSDAIDLYTNGGLAIVPPSSAGAAARAALETALLGMAAPGAGPAVMDAAFAAYAATLAAGMLGPAVSAATPPVPGTLLPLLTAAAAPAIAAPTPAAVATLAVATAIDAWFRTGTYKPNPPAPPPAPPAVPWA